MVDFKSETLDYKPYIGTKQLMASPMSRGTYNEVRGWEIPKDENPADAGYIVMYPDGYISWSPKDVFEATYRQTESGTMNFGHALYYLKRGYKVARTGWNGKNMFIFLHEGYESNENACFTGNRIDNCLPYICMKAADGNIVSGWLASQTDMLAEDWVVLDIPTNLTSAS